MGRVIRLQAGEVEHVHGPGRASCPALWSTSTPTPTAVGRAGASAMKRPSLKESQQAKNQGAKGRGRWEMSSEDRLEIPR